MCTITNDYRCNKYRYSYTEYLFREKKQDFKKKVSDVGSVAKFENQTSPL
jgi:hypothetical protein